jgi:hypothetical protein
MKCHPAIPQSGTQFAFVNKGMLGVNTKGLGMEVRQGTGVPEAEIAEAAVWAFHSFGEPGSMGGAPVFCSA